VTTATAPAVLSELELELLASIYQHRLLTTSQLHALHAPDRAVQVIQRATARLEDAGYLARARSLPPGGRESRWFHTDLGATVTAESTRLAVRNHRMDAHRARAARHLVAVNDVGVALTAAARTAGDDFTWRSWQHEVAHSTGPATRDVVIADAVLTYDIVTPTGIQSRWRFLELDRGTEAVHALVTKIRDYTSLATYKPARRADTSHLPALAWRRHYPVLPGLLFVFADLTPEQADRRIDALAGFVAADRTLANAKTPIDVTATTLDRLATPGPGAPIFTRIPTLEACTL